MSPRADGSPRGPRILHLAAVDFTILRFVAPLMKLQQAAGARVGAVCARGENFAALEEQGIEMHACPMSRRLNPLAQARAAWALYRILRRERPDIVHCHTPIVGLLGRWAGLLARVPRRLYTVHGFHFHDGSSANARRAFVTLERLGALAGHGMLFVSSEDLDAAKRLRLAPPAQLHYVGNPVDITAIRAAAALPPATRQSLGIRPASTVIGFVGRMVTEKGLGELIEATARLIAEGRDIHLLLVGGRLASDPAGDVESWERRLDEPPLQGRVSRTGLVPSAWPWLGLMDAFVLPSYREGMPVSLMEAMAAGRPCVATRIRGCRELIEDGGNGPPNGLLVTPRQADPLADALRRLLDLPAAERAALGERATESLRRNGFDVDSWYARMDGAYRALCDGWPPPQDEQSGAAS